MFRKTLQFAFLAVGITQIMSAQSAVTGKIRSTANVNQSAAVSAGNGAYAGVAGTAIQGSTVDADVSDVSNVNQSAAVAAGDHAAAFVAGTGISNNSKVS